MLILDTCSWLKIQLIYKEIKVDLLKIFQKCDILLTHQLNDELKYYLKDYLDTSLFQIFPVEKDQIEKLRDYGFDLADTSIIVLAKEKNCVVVTEDGELLFYLINSGIRTFQVADLFLSLLNLDQINKNLCYNLIKFLRERKNIGKKKFKKLKFKLQEFR